MKRHPDNFFNFEPCIDHARQVREALVRDAESSRGFPYARRSFAGIAAEELRRRGRSDSAEAFNPGA